MTTGDYRAIPKSSPELQQMDKECNVEKSDIQMHSGSQDSTIDLSGDDIPRLSEEEVKKTADILAACRSKDVARLRSLADSRGGFITDTLRRTAWPVLLGVETLSSPPTDDAATSTSTANVDPIKSEDASWKSLPRHRDEDQVQLDVNRAFIYYPHGQSDTELQHRKGELSSLIIEVLRRYPYLCYFQGFHDICQVLLLVLDEPALAARSVARLSVIRIRDFMLPTLGPTTAQLRLLPDILAKADPKLRRHVAGVEPFYALAGTLTMYAHNIEGYHDIARLFDVFLAREPVFSIYMFAQIVMDRRDEILDIDEPDMLHVILGKVPRKMDLDALLNNSVVLFERYPPETLRSWSRISSASVLKTARDVGDRAKQTMENGHHLFKQQVKELRWAEVQDRVKVTLWAYRRPARTIGMAVAVAAVAFYLRRHPGIFHAVVNIFTR